MKILKQHQRKMINERSVVLIRRVALLGVALIGLAGALVAAENGLATRNSEMQRLLAEFSRAIEAASTNNDSAALSEALHRRSEFLRGQIHFLHAASYGEKDGRHIGSYLMNMADGTSQEFPIIYGQNVCSERGDYRALPEAEVAWDGDGTRTLAGNRVRMFKVTWINPTPDVEVTSLDFVSTKSRSAPHLIAVTVER